MERLFAKGGEFYQCVQHINMRGMKDVIKECEPIISELKAAGGTFEQVKEYFEGIASQAIDLEKDPFLKNIKAIYDKEPTKPEGGSSDA